MKNFSNLSTGIVCALCFLLVYNTSTFAFQCGEIRKNVIRLHVVANSDSDEDQDVKLKVRDAILNAGAEIFDGTVNIDNAKEKITPELKELENIADKILRINKMGYSANAQLTYEYFDTRTYNDSVTLPAGKYLALKIVLGDGNGQNWWCVMFPTLCLPAAEKSNQNDLSVVFNETQKRIIENRPRYEVRFKLIEFFESFKLKGDV